MAQMRNHSSATPRKCNQNTNTNTNKARAHTHTHAGNNMRAMHIDDSYVSIQNVNFFDANVPNYIGDHTWKKLVEVFFSL